jgi:N-acyl-D-amino-acid deacylase
MNKKFYLFVFAFAFIFFLLIGPYLFLPGAGAAEYDIVIKNARVYDGSLNPSFKADIAINGDVIAKIAKSINSAAAKTVINAKGLLISPGFIDLHTHVNSGMYFPENRACLNYLKQGVTTVIVGQCGRSAWPIFDEAEDLIKRWTDEGIGPNAALLVGHGQVREMVMGMENREPTAEELEEMKALVQTAMEQGAYGLSTGLEYLPGRYGKTDEVTALVKVIAPYGGIYHTHMRNEGANLLDSVKETILISRESGAPAHISHFKAVGQKNWGQVNEACALIEEARTQGLVITADQYPYLFSSNNPYRSLISGSAWSGSENRDRLSSSDIEDIFSHLRDRQLIGLYKKISPYIPFDENQEQYLDSLSRDQLVNAVGSSLVSTRDFRGVGNTRERTFFLERLNDPEKSENIKEAVQSTIDNLGGPDYILVGPCVERELERKTLKQAASIKNKSVVDTAIQLELMGAKFVPLRMSEEDTEYIMKKDYVGTGSDGAAPSFGWGTVHIRSYSTFLHKIKKYSMERKTVSLSHVIRSQTSLPAQIMNWNDRGWIKEGYKADIVAFDPKGIKINTSISNPHRYSEGVKYLLINGKIILSDGEWTGKLQGEVIKLKKS